MPEENMENKTGESKTAVDQAKPVISETEQQLTAKVAELTGQLTEKEISLREAQKTIEAQASGIATLKAAGDEAVTAYRKLAISSNPIFTEELITGSSIAEVDASMKKITDLASGIRSRLEAELKSTIVPAGAPERSGPDTSAMSPREKIKQGIEESKK